MENIEVKQIDGNTYLYLKGRIDTNTAPLVEEEINNAELTGNVVIDAKELEYVSSSGLRVILRLAKKHKELKLINVSSEVYEIFEVTGFTDILNIEKDYKTVSVEGCEVIGEGANGIVYRLDDDTIVKAYKNPDSLDEIINERNLAKKAFVLGIPTAISYDIVRVGDSYASVFEKLTAKSLASLTANDEANVDEYTKLSVDLLKIIHSTEVRPGEMPLMKPVALEWVDRLKGHLPDETINKLHTLVENTGRDYSLIHGDYHFKNVMVQDGETLLIDMDTLCTGHPIFEFGSIYNAYQGFSMIDHSVVKKFQGFSYETATRIWKKTLELYFDTTDETVLKSVEEKAKLIGTVRLMQRGIRVHESEEFLNACKEIIIDLAAKLDTIEF